MLHICGQMMKLNRLVMIVVGAGHSKVSRDCVGLFIGCVWCFFVVVNGT